MQYAILDNYVDDNNGSNKENFKKLLLLDFVTLNEWFDDNYMIINPEKCSYMCLCKSGNDNDTFSINEFNLKII